MKHFLTKAGVLILSLLIILTATSLPVDANPQQIRVHLINHGTGAGGTWGHGNLRFMNGWDLDAIDRFVAKGSFYDGLRVVYCVQPGVPLSQNARKPEISSANFLLEYDNGVLSTDDILELLGRIFQYGFTGNISYGMTNAQRAELIATQMLVWEIIVGERDWAFRHIAPPSSFNRVTDMIRTDHPQRAAIFTHYNRIAAAVQEHSRIPSFMTRALVLAGTHEMVWDGARFL